LNSKIIIGVIAAIAVSGAISMFFALNATNPPTDGMPYTVPPQIFDEPKLVSLEGSQQIKKFSSYEEVKKFLEESQESVAYYPRHTGSVSLDRTVFPVPWAKETAELQSGQVTLGIQESVPEPRPELPLDVPPPDTNTQSYSTTNVQVKNVDEPDYIKNDEKYAYIVSDDKLTIIDAYPAESAKIILKVGIDIPPGNALQNIFLNKDRLVVFYQDYQDTDYIPEYGFAPTKVYSQLTHAVIMDVSDKENPKIVKDYSVNGYYNNARMIGDNVYLVTINDVNYPRPIIPQIRESSEVLITPDVFYFDNPEQYYNFNTISAIDIFEEKINAETFLMSGGGTIYVSEDNIYVTYQKNMPQHYYQTQEKDRFFEAILPALPADVQERIKKIIDDATIPQQEKWNLVSDILQEAYNKLSSSERAKLFRKIQDSINEYDSKIQQQTMMTIVHKIGIDGLELKYSAKAEVPGRLLNQFSMDENENRFRIATTSELYGSNRFIQYNNVYVLDENLNIVGKLEKIAEDESIYSTRFIGDRLYMVTFKRIDPFFVIDLSSDTPKVLGALKIPGYSNYLHPYDTNHIIGIGKETKENQHGGIDVLGVKVSLFDVTDVSHPVELDVETIGKSGTDSEVLSDHKALLFDKQKNILSIPIWEEGAVTYISDKQYYENRFWRGFYVFGVNPEDGITLQSKITHSNGTGYDYTLPSRSFYIGDVLYTVSSNLIKMNDITDMHEINQLRLRDQAQIIRYVE
jgi:uncharacterized secreted protein with C-terminal beta-propeller domain